MKNFSIGIDISSKTLDICIISDAQQQFEKINNEVKSIKRFFKQYAKKQVIVAMENTGRYNWALYEVLVDFDFKVYVLNPLALSKSLGLVRGKNDKIDSLRIIQYTLKNINELRQWEPTPEGIQKLKIWLTERDSRIKQKRKLITQKSDYSRMKSLKIDKELIKLNKDEMNLIDKQISHIEKNINELIKKDEELSKNAKLICSVPGVGKVLCWTILAKTENFTKIKSASKMACYGGVAPFDYQSGTSVYRKPRVSIYADKSIKSVLHMGALSAIRLDNDLREYYLRKVEEGKNKMSILNAIRNKIIHRIYAVVHNQKIYKKHLVLS